MAEQVLLTVFRDKAAPFNPKTGKTAYDPCIGRSFNSSGISSLGDVVEDDITYTSLIYHETPGSVREQILATEASGAVITLCNA